MTCQPCEIARRAVEVALELCLDLDPVRLHELEAGPDAVGGVWDHVWSRVHDRIIVWSPVEVALRLAQAPEGMAALDRHAVESHVSLATADDLLRGAVVRSGVDLFVDTWVAAHGSPGSEVTGSTTPGK